MAPTIGQAAVAAALAWVVARDVFGHVHPFFAPIAAVVCIGVATGRRLRRLAELVAGVSVGVGIGDLLVMWIGSGPWQIALVVALAMAAAVLLDSGSMIAVQAGTSAVLVATLLPPTGSGGPDRMVDTMIGGLLGIAAIALLPASPAALVHRHASTVLNALAAALRRTAEAIEKSDPELAATALREARDTQGAIERFGEALRTGREIVTISPPSWRWRRLLLRYERAGVPIDHAIRNTRVLARRTIAALKGGAPIPPPLLTAVRGLAEAIPLMRDDLAAGRDPESARAAIMEAAVHLGEYRTGHSGFSVDVMTAQLRSIVIDLLEATGLDRDASRHALPAPPPESPAP